MFLIYNFLIIKIINKVFKGPVRMYILHFAKLGSIPAECRAKSKP